MRLRKDIKQSPFRYKVDPNTSLCHRRNNIRWLTRMKDYSVLSNRYILRKQYYLDELVYG